MTMKLLSHRMTQMLHRESSGTNFLVLYSRTGRKLRKKLEENGNKAKKRKAERGWRRKA